MFDWISFNPERIKEPGVIIGLIIILVGVIINCVAKSVAPKIAQKTTKPEETIVTIIKFVGLGVVIIGCLVAVLSI